MTASCQSPAICHKKCFSFQAFVVLTQNAGNCASATSSDTEGDLARDAVNAAVEAGKLAVLQPQLSCWTTSFLPSSFWYFFASGGGQGNKKWAVSQPNWNTASLLCQTSLPTVSYHVRPPKLFHLSLFCCRREGTESVCPFWHVYPLVHLWRASAWGVEELTV